MLQLGVAFEDATFEDGAKGVGEGGAGGDAAGSARRSLAAQREAEFKAVLERQKKYADDKKTNLDGPDLVGPAEESDHIFRCIDRGVRAPDGCPVLLLRDQLLCERRRGRVFRNWDEVKIAFPPTYKCVHASPPSSAVLPHRLSFVVSVPRSEGRSPQGVRQASTLRACPPALTRALPPLRPSICSVPFLQVPFARRPTAVR